MPPADDLYHPSECKHKLTIKVHKPKPKARCLSSRISKILPNVAIFIRMVVNLTICAYLFLLVFTLFYLKFKAAQMPSDFRIELKLY